MLAKFFAPLAVKVMGGLALVLLIALGVQSIRAEHYHDKAESCEAGRKADRDAYVAAQVEAKAAQDRLNASISARYKAAAEETDREHTKALQDAHSAAERFIAGNRLRQSAQGAAGRSGPTAQGAGSSVPDEPAADAELVAVSAGDVRVCTMDHEYAASAYQWAQRLIRGGVAEPAAK
jgi:hypothetical protein